MCLHTLIFIFHQEDKMLLSIRRPPASPWRALGEEGVPGRPTEGVMAALAPARTPACHAVPCKNPFSLKDDNNYICPLIHSPCTLISSEMEISESEILLTKLPLSVREHLLTITYKIGKMDLFSIYICRSDVYKLEVMPGV